MDQFIGITIISLSILGLAYSIGNIIIALTKPLPVPPSLENMLSFHRGFMSGRQTIEVVSQ